MKTPNIPFISFRKITYLLSVFVIITGVVFYFLKGGINPGIDFTGGIIVQVNTTEDVGIADLRSALDEAGYSATIQMIGMEQDREFLIRTRAVEKDNIRIVNGLQKTLLNKFGRDSFLTGSEWEGKDTIFIKSDVVGPTIGKYISRQSVWLIFWALLLIMIYVTVRFEFVFSVAAVIALIHDVLITLTAIIITGKEVTIPIIAAFLTLIGYSLNDTIVVFDRVREDRKKYREMEFGNIVNHSINETLSRSIITSLTTLFAVVAIFILGGPVLHDFSFALIVGIITGTYSSIFIAGPLLIEFKAWKILNKNNTKKEK